MNNKGKAVSLVDPDVRQKIQSKYSNYQTVFTTPARIYVAAPDTTTWVKYDEGYLTLCTSNGIAYLTLYKMQSLELVFQHELYVDFYQYYQSKCEWFYSFPSDSCTIGFSFASAVEASDLLDQIKNSSPKKVRFFTKNSQNIITAPLSVDKIAGVEIKDNTAVYTHTGDSLHDARLCKFLARRGLDPKDSENPSKRQNFVQALLEFSQLSEDELAALDIAPPPPITRQQGLSSNDSAIQSNIASQKERLFSSLPTTVSDEEDENYIPFVMPPPPAVKPPPPSDPIPPELIGKKHTKRVYEALRIPLPIHQDIDSNDVTPEAAEPEIVADEEPTGEPEPEQEQEPPAEDPAEQPKEPVEEPAQPVEEPAPPVDEPVPPVEEPAQPVIQPAPNYEFRHRRSDTMPIRKAPASMRTEAPRPAPEKPPEAGKANVRELAKMFQEGTLGLHSLMPQEPAKPVPQKSTPPVDTFTELQIALAKRRAKMEGN